MQMDFNYKLIHPINNNYNNNNNKDDKHSFNWEDQD